MHLLFIILFSFVGLSLLYLYYYIKKTKTETKKQCCEVNIRSDCSKLEKMRWQMSKDIASQSSNKTSSTACNMNETKNFPQELLKMIEVKKFYRELLSDKSMYHDPYGIGDYLRFSPYIDSHKIQTIVEIGSRDAIDSILLAKFYQCPVFAFECNPEAIDICINNVKKHPSVTIEPLACWNKTGKIKYYPIIESKNKDIPRNLGAGSLLKTLPNSHASKYLQGSPILINSIRLDEWIEQKNIKKIDLLCIDCEGSTLQVLEGIGKKILEIGYIICEVFCTHEWENDHTYEEIDAYLQAKGFKNTKNYCDVKYVDIIYVNQFKH